MIENHTIRNLIKMLHTCSHRVLLPSYHPKIIVPATIDYLTSITRKVKAFQKSVRHSNLGGKKNKDEAKQQKVHQRHVKFTY